MKSAKQIKGKGEQTSLQGSIGKTVTSSKKPWKPSSGQRQKKAAYGISPQHGGCNSDKCLSQGAVGKQKSHHSPKIKLQLFPLDEGIRMALDRDGHNPFLELTLSARKKISSVVRHLCDKWGTSSLAMGDLVLLPFNIAAGNLSSYRWTSSDIGISAGDVHAAVGCPEIFRLRYGWEFSQLNSSASSPLDCKESAPMENSFHCRMEVVSGNKNQAERNSKELESCNTNEVTNMTLQQIIPSEPLNLAVCMNQDEVIREDFQPVKISEIEDDAAVEKTLAEPCKNEEVRVDDNLYQTPLLWSDLSNISVGGLLSEVSLQGRFNTQGTRSWGSRLASQPTAFDSLDAFIEKLKCPQASSGLPPDMPLSILDAENTCHSFGYSKSSSSKDFPTFNQSAFSGLSNQNVATGTFKCPKSEDHAQDDIIGRGGVQELKTDLLPCSVGLFNNDNSLGLSSIRWNDSLGPFDLPLTSRQIIKDDSIGIGSFVR